ncbi:MAG TPA: DUF2911 domain-containing protein [Thermoanaerobaculia bacterium]|nr:DUF2911 domain-containing protein [Thermoanaerobaculia bacterium]
MHRSKLRGASIALLVFALALGASAQAFAQRGDDSGRRSKNGKLEGTVGGVAVTVEYGKPLVNGRAVWGSLVPYGQVWRTGADEATTITFAQDVTIEGQALPAGTYSLFTVPGESEWTVVFNKVAQQWGAFNYDQAQDALRVTVEPKAAEHVEAMDFLIEGDAIVLRWAELAVPFTVAAG